MTTILAGGKSEIQLSLRVSLEKGKEWVRRYNLIVKIHKDGSVLESRIENAIPKLQSIFGPIISKSNSAKYYEVRLFLKQTDCREMKLTSRKKLLDPKGFIQLSKYHKWDYIIVLICYLEENQVQENQEFLWIDL